MGDLLPHDAEISLDVGQKILFVGANESAIKPHKEKGDDRVVFMPIGDMNKLQDLRIRNFGVALINGRIPEDQRDHAEIVVDRAKIPVVLTLEDGGRMTRMAEQYPYKHKGVVTLIVGGVIKEARSQTAQPQKPAPPADPPPQNPTAPPPVSNAPTQSPAQPSVPTPPPNPPQRLTLNELLKDMARIFRECGGDSGKVIMYFRSHGITPEMRTDSAIRQHVYRIRDGKDNGHHSVTPPPTTLNLNPELHQRICEATEACKAANEQLFGLFQEIATENEQLRARNTELEGQTADLAGQQTEIARLKGRLNPFLRAAGLPEEV